MYNQRYRITLKHYKFLWALSALQVEDDNAAEGRLGPNYVGVSFRRIVERSGLNEYSVARLTEGLTNHGLISRHRKTSKRVVSYYLITQKGDDVILSEKASIPA